MVCPLVMRVAFFYTLKFSQLPCSGLILDLVCHILLHANHRVLCQSQVGL